jgi:hypothetical protein
MADNVGYTPGTGASVASDEVTYSGDTTLVQVVRLVHVTGSEGSKTVGELVKLEDDASASGDPGFQTLAVRNDGDAAKSGTDGDYTPLSVTASGKQHVVLTRDQSRIQVSSSGLTTVTTSYAAGDTLGAVIEFTNAARKSGGTGRITSVVITDISDVIGAMDIFLFGETVTFGTDNSTPSISDTDAAKCQAMISLVSYVDLGGNHFLAAHNLSIPYVCAATSLFLGAITRTANAVFAGGADSLKYSLFVERD